MSVPQSKFTVTLPTLDTAGVALVAGQMTSMVFQVGATTYTWPIPAATAPGATITVPFSSLSPVFAPAAGASFTADAYAVDASGNGMPSTSISWTEIAAVPQAPTGFSVS